VYGYREILDLLPARAPMLMLDRLEILPDGAKARACKAVTMNEEFFLGHFPGAPIMPGVLQVAAMAQTAAALLPAPAGKEMVPYLSGLSRIKFRKPVTPGDYLVIEATPEQPNAATGEFIFAAQALVNGEVTCEGKIRLCWKPASFFALPAGAGIDPKLPSSIPATDAKPTPVIDIMNAIPHRFPFLLVDRLLYSNAAEFRLVGVKNITGGEPYMAGTAAHCVPGFLQVEMAAQVGCILALSTPENKNKLGLFMAIDEAVFHHPVLPGDQLVIDVTAEMRSRFGKGKATLRVGDRVVTETSLKFAIGDKEAAAG
jgi:3-hydroxyacyl-[acyl-carrier-protein] dehydratase